MPWLTVKGPRWFLAGYVSLGEDVRRNCKVATRHALDDGKDAFSGALAVLGPHGRL